MRSRNSADWRWRRDKCIAWVVMLALVLLWPAAAGAEMCALDDVPAATILVPHFEVDLAETGGPETSVAIYNAGATAAIAHVTLWTDLGVATLGFGVDVPAFGIQALDLHALFGGTLPDLLCNPSRTLDFAEAERLRNAHTGQPVDDGATCLGSSQADGVARGYVTIDVARICSESNPSEAGYFDGASPVAGFANQLFAKVFHFEAGVRAVSPAVHLEADSGFDATSTPRGTTFYSRFVSGGVDGREPLPSLWGAPLLAFTALDSEWTVWRGGESFGPPAGFPCSDGPDETQVTEVYCFDQSENVVGLCAGGGCLGLESQRTSPFSAEIDSPYLLGWCVLDLASRSDETDSSQAWVGSGASYGVPSSVSEAPGTGGIVLSPLCELRGSGNEPNFFVPFTDGFESGDLSAWSSSVGGGS